MKLGAREAILKAASVQEARAILQQVKGSGLYPARYVARCEKALARRVAK